MADILANGALHVTQQGTVLGDMPWAILLLKFGKSGKLSERLFSLGSSGPIPPIRIYWGCQYQGFRSLRGSPGTSLLYSVTSIRTAGH